MLSGSTLSLLGGPIPNELACQWVFHCECQCNVWLHCKTTLIIRHKNGCLSMLVDVSFSGLGSGRGSRRGRASLDV